MGAGASAAVAAASEMDLQAAFEDLDAASRNRLAAQVGQILQQAPDTKGKTKLTTASLECLGSKQLAELLRSSSDDVSSLIEGFEKPGREFGPLRDLMRSTPEVVAVLIESLDITGRLFISLCAEGSTGRAAEPAAICSRQNRPSTEKQGSEESSRQREEIWELERKWRAAERKIEERAGEDTISIDFLRGCRSTLSAGVFEEIQRAKGCETQEVLLAIRQSVDEAARENLKVMVDNVPVERSRQLITKLRKSLQAGSDGNRQDSIYTGAGLTALLRDGHAVKKTFDALGKEMAAALQKHADAEAWFLPAPVKSTARATEKVDIKGLGDAACLGDVVRGTLVLAASRDDLMEVMYEFFEALVTEGNVSGPLACARDAMARHGAHVRTMKDRYARPKGEYRDWLLQFDVEGFVSEMQFNFNVGIVDKEGDLHLQYEKQRKLEDNLLQATMHCNVLAVDSALKAGAKVHRAKIHDARGRTPLHYAAFHGQAGMVISLLAKRASPLVGDDDGLLPINRAIIRNHSDVIRILADAMKEMRNDMSAMPDSQKHALLIGWGIAQQQRRKHAEVLLEVADIALPSKPIKLYAAAAMANGAICQEIIELVGGLDQPDLFRTDPACGHTIFPLDAAIVCGNTLAAVAFAKAGGCLMLDPDNKPGAVHSKPQYAAEQYVTNQMGAQLQAFLAIATIEPRPRFQSLRRERNKEWKDMADSTIDIPQLASKALGVRNFSALCALREYGSKLPVGDVPAANMLLMEASRRGALDDVEALLESRAQVNSIDDGIGCAPLHYAATIGNVRMCKLLVDFQADIELQDATFKQVPLVHASAEGRLESMRFLLDAKASPDVLDKWGLTPSYYAVEAGHLPAVQLLHVAGAAMPHTTNSNLIRVAQGRSHAAVASFLEQLQSS